MGFYGNITNTNRTQFVFDKIYPNRTDMEKATTTDGIFIGRFVLVDYNEGFSTPDYYQQVYKHDTLNYWYSDVEKKSRAEYYDAPYYIKNEDGSSSINPLADSPEYRGLIFKDEPVYVIDNGQYVFYQCTGVDTIYHKYATFVKMAKGPSDTDAYYNNFAKDRATYGKDIGRGWDSTVWQKVYTDNTEKYVMIAELNSVVPTLGITVDAPSLNPIAPHFDADSTNVYYRLHMQPSWGMRVAPVNTENGELSDEEVSYSGSQWNPDLKKQEWIFKQYDGAIYYNRDGFDPDIRYEKEKMDDKISLLPTGKSGNKYNDSHESGRETKTEQPDIQELTINLPSIGNTMSNIWDLVYGTGKLAEGEENIYRRNKNIAWNNIAGERLVRENIDGTGFDYNPEQVDTIAGCINSVHDLMGMIITQEVQKQDESDEEFEKRISIDNALTNRIYYGNYEPDRILNGKPYQGFYIKSLTYEYDTGTHENVIEPISLKDFSAENYYYINNNNYYLEVNGYRSGNKYYTLNEKVVPKTDLYEKDWEPNKYYYFDSGDYILDGSKWPDENKVYYIVEPGFQVEINSNQKQFFFPTDEDYFKAYFADQRGEKDENGIAYGNGLFYLTTEPDTNIPLYKPFYVGLPYTTPLYWFDNYRIETSTGIDGQPVEVYDFDKGAVKTEYNMIQFVPDTYFWFNPETNNYETLLTEKEIIERNEANEIIPISKIYKSFKQESIITIPGDFYEPDVYYYQEGNDYILATEEKRAKDLNSYFTIEAPKDYIKDIFYEPNCYHYKDNITGEYILDTDEFDADKQYYLIHYLYVEEDPNGILLPGSKINENIDLSKLPGLKYGPRYETYEWKELVGFARTLNTIHGLLMDMNNVMRTGDTLTRDKGTIQGCINTINDIINNIYELIPDYFIAVDKYGRMTSMKPIGDDWIQVDINKEDNGKVVITHIGPVEKDARNENNETPEFGSTFEIEDWVFDDKGHQTNKSVHTVKIPQGSLSDQTKTGSDIITQLSFVPSTGALTSTRENLSSIKLADYVKDNDNNDVAATDTLGQALSKLQTQIIEEEEARATIIDALDMNDEDTTHFISKITQTDGKVSVVRAAAGTLKIADADGSYSVPETSSSIEKEDTLAIAFGKVEAQINTANKTHENNINSLNNTINGLNANIGTETSEVITVITQTAGLVSASKQKVGNLTLTGWAIGEVDADNVPITDADTIFNAFVKTQRQINANKKALDLLNGDSSKVDSVNYKIENTLTKYNLTNLAERVDNLEQAIPAEKIAIWDGVVSDYVSKAVYNEALNKIQNLEGRIAALEALIIPPEPPTETEPDNGTEEP